MMADSAANATPPNTNANTGGENLPRHSLEFPDASAGQARELLAFLESWEGEEELLALEGDGDASATMTMSPLTAGIPASGSSSWRALGDSPTSLSLSFCTSSGEENKRARERPEEQHAAAPPKKRVRRIVEITQLRHEASVLEKTLSDLNEYWKRWKNVRAQAAYRTGGGGGIFTSNRVFRHTTNNSSAERNANRHRQLRSTAEEENRKLREEYQCRRKNTKAFYKLLKRRATTYPEFNCVFQLMQQPAASQEVLARSGDIFQALLQDVHRMQIERERIDSIIESRRRPICTFRDWNVREDGDEANGIFLELVDSAVLPFDRLQVNRAMHRLYSEQTSTTTHFCEYSHVSANKDTIIRQAVCAYSNADREGHVRHQDVMRNESDDTHSLFLRVTRIQPVGSKGEPIAGLSLLEKQWTFIRSGGGDDDGQEEEASSGSSCSGALSTVQSYHKITLVSVDGKYEAFWAKEMIMDSMVPMWDFSRAKAHRRLESFLIDQGISNSRRLQASEVR